MSEVLKQSEMNDEPLRWLAFRYVSDEMSDAEVAEFEGRLNPDSEAFEVAACEAVARAVQLNDAVAVACEPVARPATQAAFEESGRRNVAARRVSLLAASVTVLAVGWALTLSDVPQPADVVEHPALQPLENPSDMTGELVQIWADSSVELLSVVEDVRLLPAENVPEVFSTDVPDWLLAAVQTHDASATSPEVLEN
jgi:hypothetical protein